MAYKKYGEAEVAEALVRLAVNHYDWNKTEEQTGIPVRTLRRWDKDVPKKGVPDLLERAITRLLMVIPKDLKGSDWAITLGILMDKWLLIQGEPTERTESLVRTFEALSEDERHAVVERAREIISGFGAISDNGSNGRAV